MAELIKFKGVKRYYDVGSEIVKALDGVDLTINHNEYENSIPSSRFFDLRIGTEPNSFTS